MTKKLADLIEQIKGNNAGVKRYAMESLKQFRLDEQLVRQNPTLTAHGRAEQMAKLREGYKENHVRTIGKAMQDNAKVRKEIVDVATTKLSAIYDSKPEDSPETTIFNRKLQTLKFDILTAPDKARALDAVNGLRSQYNDPAYLLTIQNALREITPNLTGDREALLKVRQIDGGINRDIEQVDDEIALASDLIDDVDVLQDELIANDQRSMSAFAALKPTMDSADIREFGKDPSLFVVEYEKLDDVATEEPTTAEQ